MKTRGRSWGNNWEICEEEGRMFLARIIWKRGAPDWNNMEKAKTMGLFDKKMEICVKYW